MYSLKACSSPQTVIWRCIVFAGAYFIHNDVNKRNKRIRWHAPAKRPRPAGLRTCNACTRLNNCSGRRELHEELHFFNSYTWYYLQLWIVMFNAGLLRIILLGFISFWRKEKTYWDERKGDEYFRSVIFTL